VRRPNDGYFTRHEVAESVADWLGPASDPILEPSVGRGAFARALRKRGHHVVGIDIDPKATGFVECSRHEVGDFLRWETATRFGLVIGNPPYSDAELHIDRALELLKPDGRLCFLLRLNFLGASKRIDVWQTRWNLERIGVIVPRPSFTEGGNDSCEYAAFVFSLHRGPTSIEWIRWK
jgi:tRNA1(Val) A37 N6-methylase TrmN6